MNKGSRCISVIIKVLVVISVLAGVKLGLYFARINGSDGSSLFKTFTLLSNVYVAAICIGELILCAIKSEQYRLCHILKYLGTTSIVLTGLTYCLVLAPTIGDEAWALHNVLLHVVVPVLFVIDYLINCVVYKLKKLDFLYSIIPCGLYLIFCIFAYINKIEFMEGNYYPYFFLNWGSRLGAFGIDIKSFPFLGTMWWIILIILVVLLIGIALLKIQKLIILKSEKQDPNEERN